MSQEVDLVCYGELLWDNLPTGSVPGGAPFNIVNRATALGLQSYVISSIGDDRLGRELIDIIQSKGNATTFIQRHATLPTGQVNIEVGIGGEPKYQILYPVAWDDIRPDSHLVKLVSSAKAFIYSSLALRDARSRSTLFHLLQHASLKICDVNLRAGNYEKATIMQMIEEADILRMNEYELSMVAEWLGIAELDNKSQLNYLNKRYGYQAILTTLGEEGAVCLADGKWYNQPVFKVQVADTVGAGDAFLAAFTYKLLNQNSIQECLRFGCAVGGLTASKHGGTPEITPEEIENMLG